MGASRQAASWDHWERHPAGEEILTLLSGELEIVLEIETGEERAVLTAGAGTEHRPVTL